MRINTATRFAYALVMLSASLCWTSCQQRTDTALLVVRDFRGTFEAGSTIPVTYTIKNLSNRTFNIAGVMGQCGCTTCGLDRQLLEPGEIAQVQCTVESSRLAVGDNQLHFVALLSDGSSIPILNAGRATVTQSVFVTPKSVNLTGYQAGEGFETRCVVRSTREKRIVYVDVSRKPHWMHVDVPLSSFPSTSEREECDVTLMLSGIPPADTRVVEESIQLTCRLSDNSEVEVNISIHGMIEPLVKIDPSVWMIGFVRPTVPVTRAFRVFPTYDRQVPLVIHGITAEEGLKVEEFDCLPSEGASILSISISVAEDALSSSMHKLVVTGMVGSTPFTLTIPCVAYVETNQTDGGH